MVVKINNLEFKIDNKVILENINLEIKSGEFVAITGKSGIGKTTLLKLISGILKPSSGRILIDKDKIGFVFQEPRLFPWLSAEKNVQWGNNKKELARKLLADFGLYNNLNYFPHQLSFGMQKRVALARAVALDSKLLLLDEPFSALDPLTREIMQNFLIKYQKQENKTVIMVTHQIEEASLADRIINFSGVPASVELNFVCKISRQ